MEYEIQRFCWFDTVGKKETSRETIWKYKRAIEGHKFILVDFETSVEAIDTFSKPVRFQIYDGHTFSHWGSFPGIYDQSTLRLHIGQGYAPNNYSTLNSWECKEFTLSARNESTSYDIQFLTIVYFYEVPMNKIELLEYAVKQPRYKYRHGSATTLDRFED